MVSSVFDMRRRVEDWATALGNKFRRIFTERGVDFFEKDPILDASDEGTELKALEPPPNEASSSDAKGKDGESGQNYMTPEMLFKLRMEVLPRLK